MTTDPTVIVYLPAGFGRWQITAYLPSGRLRFRKPVWTLRRARAAATAVLQAWEARRG